MRDVALDRRGAAVIGALVLVMSAALAWMGRSLWCACGSLVPWSLEVWSMHNSQHLFDAYAFTHVLHGVAFYAVFRLMLGGRYPQERLLAALTLESLWEVVENTQLVIDRYRENTTSLDYVGDSIGNSVADLVFCGLGYLFAASFAWWASGLMFLAFELLLLAWIRDGLLLNVLMLVYPLDLVKQWQSGG